MSNTMRFSLLLLAMMLIASLAHADNKKQEAPKAQPSIDMLELLGELGDEDPNALESAMNDVDQHPNPSKTNVDAQKTGVKK